MPPQPQGATERGTEAEGALQEVAATTVGEQREAAALVVERVAMRAELQRLSRQAIGVFSLPLSSDLYPRCDLARSGVSGRCRV